MPRCTGSQAATFSGLPRLILEELAEVGGRFGGADVEPAAARDLEGGSGG